MIKCWASSRNDSNQLSESDKTGDVHSFLTPAVWFVTCKLIVYSDLRGKALIGRYDRLLTWCLYGCRRAEPERKRLVFFSRCKSNQLTTESLDSCKNILPVNTSHNSSVWKQTHSEQWRIIEFTFPWRFFFASCELRYLLEEIVLSVRLQIQISDLVVGIWDVGAVSPLGQDDGLHVFPVQTATLWSVSRQLRRGEVVLVGGNIDCINILLMSPNVNIYTQAYTPE